MAAGARASHSTVSAPWASERSLAPSLAWKPGIDSRTPVEGGGGHTDRAVRTAPSASTELAVLIPK